MALPPIPTVGVCRTLLKINSFAYLGHLITRHRVLGGDEIWAGNKNNSSLVWSEITNSNEWFQSVLQNKNVRRGDRNSGKGESSDKRAMRYKPYNEDM